MKVAIAVLFLAAVVLADDAESWKQKGIAAANQNLENFDAIASGIAQNDAPAKKNLARELRLVSASIKDAAENNRRITPIIEKVISTFNFLVRGDPGLFRKVGLKGAVALLNGRRDNKSYYVLDGAQQWAGLRIEVLQKFAGNPAVDQLIADLTALQAKTVDVRELLEERAQNFVRGLKKLHAMSGDIGKNLDEIQATAEDMSKASETKDAFLNGTADLETLVKELVKKYSA